MSVFNSLGSNYDLSFALKALFPEVAKLIHLPGGISLEKFLEEKYGGEATLLFKGREAITLALKQLSLPKDTKVAINGFTCYTVYKAIEEAGCKPMLIDIPKDDLNFTFTRSDLTSTLAKNPDIKAVIVQNTLGFPCDIDDISKICKEKNIFLIEDLAHCAGAKYKNGKEAGMVGDCVIFSFSQDKIIDGVSGGALIVRKPRRLNAQNLRGWENKNPSIGKRFTDRIYPVLTLLIRSTYDLGFGELLHYFLKNVNLLSVPMDNSSYDLTKLPNFYQSLALSAFENLTKDIEHRKKIAKIYKNNLNKKIISDSITSKIDFSSNLRFPIFVNNRENLIKFLKTKGFYISDIWYDAPIAPKRFMKKINYLNNCPNAEKISDTILNLPTHKNISKKQALYLSELINTWLK